MIFDFEGTSCTVNMTGQSAGASVGVSIDGGAFNPVAVGNNSFADVSVASGLSDGWHTVQLNCAGVPSGLAVTSANSVKVTGATPNIRRSQGFDLYVLGNASNLSSYLLAPGWAVTANWSGGLQRLRSTSSVFFFGRAATLQFWMYGEGFQIQCFVDGHLVQTNTPSGSAWQMTRFDNLDATKDHVYEVCFVYRGGVGAFFYAFAAGGPTSGTLVALEPPEQRIAVAGLGDSLIDTNECNSSVTTNGWFWRFCREYNVQPHNWGIGGSSAGANGTANTAAMLAGVSPPPALLFIQWGTNDRGSYTAGQFQTNYAAVLASIAAAWPTTLIYCMSIFQYADADSYNAAIVAAIASTLTTYPSSSIKFLSTAGWFVSGDTCDGTHPTISGHTKILAAATAAMAAVIAPYILGNRVQVNSTGNFFAP